MNFKKKTTALLAAMLLLSIASLYAQKDEAAELAKKLANPIASLISIPFQNNTDYGIGSMGGTRNTMNFQPVVPIGLSKNLNLITRVVLPIVTQYNITGPGQKQNGLGDAVLSGFFSPTNTKNGFTWGVGPVLLIPTGTNDFLTAKKFGLGPTAIALHQHNGLTIGALVNQIWSVAGSSSRADLSQFFAQPFLTYNWKSGAGLGGMFEWTQNWKANSSTLWFVPSISGLTSLGKQKVSLAIGPRFNLASPSGSSKADWGWRAAAIFLFPK